MSTVPQAVDLRYPVGKFEWPGSLSDAERARCLEQIAQTPANLRAAVAGLSPQQLDTPYRPGGWTVRQVAHHVPDSHMNAYIRFKLALTEEQPTIKPYKENLWAELPDTAATPIETSLRMLELLHDRWVRLMRAMTAADFQRTLVHPEIGVVKLERFLATYAWHGRHHTAHITALRSRNGW
jgi:uncharacterized damage-inducible protein DinB